MDATARPANSGDSPGRPGGALADGADPAFHSWRGTAEGLPVLIAVPHAGRAYPEDVADAMREAAVATLRLEDRHADTLALEAARQCGAALLIARAPRAMIDLNRAPDDIDWGMMAGGPREKTRHSLANRRARSGLGLVPRRLPGIGEIWRRPLARAELERRIETIHRPYHRVLGEMLEAIRDRWGAALLLDVHSMPPLRMRFPDERPAEYVLGDRFGASCDSTVVEAAESYLAAHGRPTARNRPYSGGYVLERHASPRRGIHALQLEICRTAYLDARLEEPSARLASAARLIAGLAAALGEKVAAMGRDGPMLEAAE